MNKTTFKLLIVLLDLLLCYTLRKFFNAPTEALILLKSVIYCNVILISCVFWCWGIVKMIHLINKKLDTLYLDVKKSFKTGDIIENMKTQIEEAIENEDYEKAAILKKRLDRKLKR